MVTRTSMNGSSSKPAKAIARNATEFVGDVVTLGELQFKLLTLDLRDGSRKLLLPLTLVAIGGCCVIGGVTVLLASLGIALRAYLPLWGALLCAGLAGLVIGGGFLAVATRLLTHPAAILDRSRTEWNKNLQWFKSALSGRPTTHQEN